MKTAILIFFLIYLPHISYTQWIEQSSGTNRHLNSSFFLTNDIGFVVGDTGTVISTIDGGTNWNQINISTDQKLNSICFVNQNEGFIVGNSGVIFKTVNGGSSWNSLTSNVSNNLFDVKFISSNIGWASGSNIIIGTTDGGQNWNIVSNSIQNQGSWNSINPINNQSIIALGNSQKFASTSDNGINWNEIQIGTEQGKICCAFVDQSHPSSNVGYSISNSGELFSTSNSGLNWILLDSTSIGMSEIKGIDFPLDNLGWIVGDGIITTSNNGITWSTQENPSTNSLNDVFFLNPNYGFAVGRNGTILKTINSGLIGLDEISGSRFTLFPNPSNKVLTINFSSNLSNEKISILSPNGQILMTKKLTSEVEQIDVSSFSRGIYFVRIGNQIEKFVKE